MNKAKDFSAGIFLVVLTLLASIGAAIFLFIRAGVLSSSRSS